MAGAFIISRDIFDGSLWKNPIEFRLFFLILGQAIFSDTGKDIGGIHLNKGQWLRSYRNIQEDLEWIENNAVKRYSLDTIKRTVDKLVLQERVSICRTELGTLFTVTNYAKYQDLETYRQPTSNEASDSNRTPAEHLPNNNNKDKKDKKDNIYTPEFESWYKSWPRASAKKDSFKNFEKRRKEHGLEFILMCSKNYLDYFTSLPSKDQGYPYQSNNFFGEKAYYLDYEKPKAQIKTQPQDQTKPVSPPGVLFSIYNQGGD